ncbi:hypothetical protein LNP18_02875 [Leuconostoc citreum]|uniref:hypothetical protein n=1 Tax=Leuconostoc citreum TaxID=33964 RepID=UPI00200A155C|nr:hypothetical protein [Leuconostoc citreum]MCK8605041.1 hypothetical protein [Leuconostoc citreum]
MTHLNKFIASSATFIISLDIILMVINGTMLYVVITIVGFYFILSLAFKKSALKVLRCWIQTGQAKIKDKHYYEQEKHSSRIKF